MVKSGAWKTYFNVSDPQIPLHQALKDRVVNESQYLQWASQHYQIPVLEKTYFQSQFKPTSELWNKFKNLKKWNNTFVPIEEWNDVLYVGCLEPVESAFDNENQSVVFVLAPHEDLESLWKNFNSEDSKKNILSQDVENESTLSLVPSEASSLNKNFEKKEETPLLSEKTNLNKSFEEDSKKNILSQDVEDESTLSLVPSEELSSNKNFEKKEETPLLSEKTNLNKSFEEENKKNILSQDVERDSTLSLVPSEELPEIQKPEKKEKQQLFNDEMDLDDSFEVENQSGAVKAFFGKVANLMLKTPSKKQPSTSKQELGDYLERTRGGVDIESLSESSQNEDRDQQKKLQKDESSIDSESVVPASKVSNKEVEAYLESTNSGIDMNLSNKESPDLSQDNVQQKDIQKTEPPVNSSENEHTSSTQTLSVMTSSAPDGTMSVMIKNEDNSSDLEQSGKGPSAVRMILENTKKYVDYYIMFTCFKQKFKPVKWSYNLKPKNKEQIAIKRPSFFRIAYYSKKSYFGYVPAILGNTEFFENWNFSSVPEQIVFIPFIDKDDVLGGYLGIISKTVDSSLDLLDTLHKSTIPLKKHYKNVA